VDEKLKRRLTGAAVLVALAVIFLPELLDRDAPGPERSLDLSIPPPPDRDFDARQPVAVEIPPVEAYPGAETALDLIRRRAAAGGGGQAAASGTEYVSSSSVSGSGPGEDVEAKPRTPEPVAKSVEPPAPEPSAPKATAKPAPAPQRSTASPPVAAVSGGGASEKPAALSAAWVVQVGSFKDQSNAQALLNKLRAAGYATRVEPASVGGSRVYRVKVGPELERAAAEKLIADLQTRFGLRGTLRRHPDG
jgi:DedD protein